MFIILSCVCIDQVWGRDILLIKIDVVVFQFNKNPLCCHSLVAPHCIGDNARLKCGGGTCGSHV